MKLKPPKPGRTEKQVQEQVFAALAMYSWLVEVKRQNVGAMTNASGRTVRFNEAGDSDIRGQFVSGPWKGCVFALEVKREGFDPRRVRGAERVRFLGQLEKLKRVNANGGIGCWVSDSAQLFPALRRISEGWRVEFDEHGFPWLVSPDECRKTGSHVKL